MAVELWRSIGVVQRRAGGGKVGVKNGKKSWKSGSFAQVGGGVKVLHGILHGKYARFYADFCTKNAEFCTGFAQVG